MCYFQGINLMKYQYISRILLIFSLFFASTMFAQAKNGGDIYAENKMAIVHIEVAADPQSPNKKPIIGTGFIVNSDGVVLTAGHVLDGYINQTATPISVHVGGLILGMPLLAEPIRLAADPQVDVAILRLPPAMALGLSAYQSVRRGDSHASKIGDDAFTIGFDGDQDISFHPGTLSSTFIGGAAANSKWLFQMPGVVNGMSGAPVFNASGEVIGLVTNGGSGNIAAYPEQATELVLFETAAGWSRGQSSMRPLPTPAAGVFDGQQLPRYYRQQGDMGKLWMRGDIADEHGSYVYFFEYQNVKYGDPIEDSINGKPFKYIMRLLKIDNFMNKKDLVLIDDGRGMLFYFPISQGPFRFFDQDGLITSEVDVIPGY
jgi:hypothetical protein